MLIDEQTKIAVLLRHHPDALETIIRLSPDFEKLRNPVLRKLMAGRTSIAMAAKIGGCHPEDFFKKLEPLGFEVNLQTAVAEETPGDTKPIPVFLKELKEEELVPLDVRPMLAEGKDPLKQIQQEIRNLKTGQVLKIINSFEPTPLLKLLENQGFQSYVDARGENWVETYFYKSSLAKTPVLEMEATSSAGWDQSLKRFRDKLQAIDVRHLEMPQPMMTILEALGRLPHDHALFVHHKRIPVFLLTELKERNFDYRIRETGEGEVSLLIFHN
ncbi:MAG: DUF2249 domain-containing protein [Bacteroidota bacterium]|nr:DUF2249 domain-containing protein [Bacteroidota bacterium]